MNGFNTHFMMATAMETIVVTVEKMCIMESGDGVHTAVATATENSILLVAIAVEV